MSNPSLSISSLVFFRKNAGLTQADVATAMSITQSAVARLEKRLLSDADVTLKTLERYAEAVGIRMHVDFEPKAHKGKLFKNPCSQAELNKIVPFGFSLQRQKMVFFCH